MRARVLVVDDDEVYLSGIKELLEGAGYDMLVASTFEDGKRVLQNNTPDLMIIDVRLGGVQRPPADLDRAGKDSRRRCDGIR